MGQYLVRSERSVNVGDETSGRTLLEPLVRTTQKISSVVVSPLPERRFCLINSLHSLERSQRQGD